MFKAINKPAKFVYVPTEIFDFSISIIEFIAKTWPSQKWEDVLETSKIGKYYAVEVSQYDVIKPKAVLSPDTHIIGICKHIDRICLLLKKKRSMVRLV